MIEDNEILNAIEELRKKSKRRRFVQTVELIVNLKNIDPNKPENKIEDYIVLPKGRGKKPKIAAFVDKSYEKAKEVFDLVIKKEDMEKIAQNKRQAKKIAKNYDYFVSEVTVMPFVGKYFGRFLAPRGKMPSPKGKMIFPPTADLKKIRETLDNTVVIRFDKKHRVIMVPVGTEDMKNEDLLENIKAVLNTLLHDLPRGKENIESIFIKTTMGPSIRVK